MNKNGSSILLSIIVPVYNGELYILDCIKSLVEQGFSENEYEVLVINDGSKDNTRTIVEKLTKKYPAIKLINKDNGGVSSARNIGIQNASGKYIGFADCDDSIMSNTLKTIIDIMDNNSIHFFKYDFSRDIENIKNYDGNYIITSGEELAISTVWQCIFFRETIINNNILFYENICFSEDNLFILQYLLSETGKMAKGINCCIYHYRVNINQVTYKKKKDSYYGNKYMNSVLLSASEMKKIAIYKNKANDPMYKKAISSLLICLLWDSMDLKIKNKKIIRRMKLHQLSLKDIKYNFKSLPKSKANLKWVIGSHFNSYIILMLVTLSYKVYKFFK